MLTACSSGGGGGNDNTSKQDSASQQQQQSQITFADTAGSTGPADPVAGATTGGTLNILQRDTFAHLDPAQVYVNDQGMLQELISRGLTTYRMNSKGKYSVVGDLATNSGEQSDGGKTWKFTLKDNVKWQDGKAVSSADIRQSVERLFASYITSGPIYLQQWLADVNGTDYRKLLPDGPYKGKHLPNSILETPDSKTVIFHFKTAHPDLPYVLAMSGYSAVPAAKDTKQKYDKAPVASGPYKIQSFDSGKGMVLVKNTEWDASSDSARHQYADEYNITFNVQEEDYSKRVMSDNSDSQNATTFTNAVDTTNIQTVVSTPSMKKRTVYGYQPYVGQINFNMKKITDKQVRQALAYAIPTKPIYSAMGATYGAEIAGNFISPTISGYQATDPLGKKAHPMGEPAKAKAILKKIGKLNTKITYAYINTPQGQEYSVAIANVLKKAGFDVQRKELDSATYYDLVGKVNNDYDIYASAWGADWPSSLSVIPPVFDGRTIQDGASNYSHLNDSHVNSEIDRISKITDPSKAAKEWFKLNTYIETKIIPAVPTIYYKQLQIYGSKVGGAVYNNVLSNIDPTKLYVKK
jgi:peptide/nickel transport system substrate-binding protein